VNDEGSPRRLQHVPELERYLAEKGTLRFPLDEPLPVTLIRRLVQARVRGNEAEGPLGCLRPATPIFENRGQA
jgi:hypothetical protein